MAVGKKTGGRDFRPGQGGRKKGSKDKIPRSVKASMRAIFEDIATNDPQVIRDAMIKGLTAPPPKSFSYLQLMAHYLDGKPAERPAPSAATTGLPESFLQNLERVWQAHLAGIPVSQMPIPGDPRLAGGWREDSERPSGTGDPRTNNGKLRRLHET